MGVIISLKDVKKIYKMGDEKIVALNDINLDFEKGKIYCLLGTSGSGKSTLLNMIAGLEKPTGGTIVFNQEERSLHIEKLNETKFDSGAFISGVRIAKTAPTDQ
jgi:putative ABC transport system ATP-binding protein